jgi:hypothetical protein
MLFSNNINKLLSFLFIKYHYLNEIIKKEYGLGRDSKQTGRKF